MTVLEHAIEEVLTQRFFPIGELRCISAGDRSDLSSELATAVRRVLKVWHDDPDHHCDANYDMLSCCVDEWLEERKDEWH